MAKFSLSGLPDLSMEKSPKRAHLASFSEKSPIKPPNLLGFSNVSHRFRLSGGGRFLLSTDKNERFAKIICPRSARYAPGGMSFPIWSRFCLHAARPDFFCFCAGPHGSYSSLESFRSLVLSLFSAEKAQKANDFPRETGCRISKKLSLLRHFCRGPARSVSAKAKFGPAFPAPTAPPKRYAFLQIQIPQKPAFRTFDARAD